MPFICQRILKSEDHDKIRVHYDVFNFPQYLDSPIVDTVILLPFQLFKELTSNSHSSAIADHMTQTGHRTKWDHFDILATRQSDIHCKIKEAWLIRDLKPAALNENIGSEKLLLY